MSSAVIFDWDGTLVSCEEKINLAVTKLCTKFSGITKPYKAMVTKRLASSGWIRKGFIASLPEDYLSYHFGIVAKLLMEVEGLETDPAWSIILSMFKESYLEVRSRMIVDVTKLEELAKHAALYVVSNSEVSNIKSEAKELGIRRGIVSFIGNAKKYDVVAAEPSILGIPVNRPKYQELLNELKKKHGSITVAGDNFSLDLVTPIAMGVGVAYIPNPLTPKAVIRYVKKNRITCGSIDDVLDILISNKGDIS